MKSKTDKTEKKMTYAQCIDMLNALSEMDNVPATELHTRLTYAIAKNKRRLTEIHKDLQAKLKRSEGFEKFMKEKSELLKRLAEKDENGKPVIGSVAESIEGPVVHYKIKGGTNPGSPFAKELDELRDKYKEDIEKREKQEDDYNNFIITESEFEPHMITDDLLPEKGIPQKAMDGLIYMIKEEPVNKRTVKKK